MTVGVAPGSKTNPKPFLTMSTQHSNVSKPASDLQRCHNCGGEPEPGFKLALCPDCRKRLAKKPIPWSIKVAGTAVAAAVICALVRVPTSISGASAFERGQRDEARHRYQEAAAEYRTALNAFPDATLPLARLAIVEYRDGDYNNAAQTLHQLAGRKAGKELRAEVNSVIHEMERSEP
jgi:hypothetical protein